MAELKRCRTNLGVRRGLFEDPKVEIKRDERRAYQNIYWCRRDLLESKSNMLSELQDPNQTSLHVPRRPMRLVTDYLYLVPSLLTGLTAGGSSWSTSLSVSLGSVDSAILPSE